MSYDELVGSCIDSYDQSLPFVIYASPDSSEITGHFQGDRTLHLSEAVQGEAFIFAPFQSEESPVCIPYKFSWSVTTTVPSKAAAVASITYEDSDMARSTHMALVSSALEYLEEKDAEKVVVSRRATVDLKQADLRVIMNRLFTTYPSAFRYIWFHPETGMWCGATPEVLLKADGATFETMSLAGTRGFVPGNVSVWTEKEQLEQQLVTDYITERLQKVTKVLKVSKPYEYQAGNLFHLRSDIKGVLKNGTLSRIMRVAGLLHPTPAVCGIPLKGSKKFLTKYEGYDREYYTGYLGPITTDNGVSQLYVNLRCMKIEEGKAHLYVGGGITSASDPDSEWVETQNKLQTMLQVIWPLVKE